MAFSAFAYPTVHGFRDPIEEEIKYTRRFLNATKTDLQVPLFLDIDLGDGFKLFPNARPTQFRVTQISSLSDSIYTLHGSAKFIEVLIPECTAAQVMIAMKMSEQNSL